MSNRLDLSRDIRTYCRMFPLFIFDAGSDPETVRKLLAIQSDLMKLAIELEQNAIETPGTFPANLG